MVSVRSNSEIGDRVAQQFDDPDLRDLVGQVLAGLGPGGLAVELAGQYGAAAEALGALFDEVAADLAAAGAEPRALAEALVALRRCADAWLAAIARATEAAQRERDQADRTAYRQRLAREIHDQFGNGLSVVMRRLDLYKLTLERHPAAAAERMDAVSASLDELFGVVRWITTDLRPCEAGPTELETALWDFVHSVEPARTDITISVHGWEHGLSDELRCEVVSVLREAMRNTLAHADAARLDVAVQVSSAGVRATVADDGTGFDPTVPGEGNGHGLRSMAERVAGAGGTLRVASEPGAGTKIEVWFPLDARGGTDGPAAVPVRPRVRVPSPNRRSPGPPRR
ncbi:histidine kinase [Dactylosporangium sp. AC04546]|uniref:sensor histidine kinase n=1 Tax=Dactylosporangium sp. AC04546 TaxID=2862460 RepID=UPI001EDD0ADE|nr:histidine kinase [Dactylosporangium sp. AC04546]WVK81338.1 histidine kinase [Dactylosporangium sp. AC04546]